jgi:hypothetical protein
MTDKELTRRAKTLRANLLMDGEKINFADACKIILLSDFMDGRMTQGQITIAFNNIRRSWWRLFF